MERCLSQCINLASNGCTTAVRVGTCVYEESFLFVEFNGNVVATDTWPHCYRIYIHVEPAEKAFIRPNDLLSEVVSDADFYSKGKNYVLTAFPPILDIHACTEGIYLRFDSSQDPADVHSLKIGDAAKVPRSPFNINRVRLTLAQRNLETLVTWALKEVKGFRRTFWLGLNPARGHFIDITSLYPASPGMRNPIGHTMCGKPKTLRFYRSLSSAASAELPLSLLSSVAVTDEHLVTVLKGEIHEADLNGLDIHVCPAGVAIRFFPRTEGKEPFSVRVGDANERKNRFFI